MTIMASALPTVPEIVASIRTSKKEKRLPLILAQAPHLQGQVLGALPNRIRKPIINTLQIKELLIILNHLDPTQATDLLQTLPVSKAKKVTQKLAYETRQKVEFLLKFAPDTAAGLMNLDYVLLPKEIKFSQAAELALEHEKRAGTFPNILIEDNGQLVGEVPLQELLRQPSHKKVTDSIKPIPSISYLADWRSVTHKFQQHPHQELVVLDDDGSVLGLIHTDDILALLNQERGHSLYSFAGVKSEEDILDSGLNKVHFRYRWLILNLLTAFMAAWVVAIFEGTLERLVLLAAYMPVVAGMGGNTGTQAMAVTVRGLVYHQPSLSLAKKVISQEIVSGIVNGFVIGVIVTLVAYLVQSNLLLGLVAGVSLIITMVVASMVGSLIPILMKALGKDPASSASIFITTATDMVGFFVFLGLASLIL